jgi:hypothetical protein
MLFVLRGQVLVSSLPLLRQPVTRVSLSVDLALLLVCLSVTSMSSCDDILATKNLKFPATYEPDLLYTYFKNLM